MKSLMQTGSQVYEESEDTKDVVKNVNRSILGEFCYFNFTFQILTVNSVILNCRGEYDSTNVHKIIFFVRFVTTSSLKLECD